MKSNLTWITGPIYGALLLTLSFACASTPTSRSTGQVLDDSAIAARVKSALLADPVTDGIDIEVDVYQGRVQLLGFTQSDQEQTRAVAIATQTNGVSKVHDGLERARSDRRVGEYVDDKILLTRVNAALAGAEGVSSLEIEVEVNRGVVLLGGFVDHAAQIELAGAAAAGASGAQRVINHIVTK